MTLLRIQVQTEPGADAAPTQQMRVRRASDRVSVISGNTDPEGFYTWQVSAGPQGPVYFVAEEAPGGDRYWDSRDHFHAGVVALSDIPAALFPLEGVVAGYRECLEVTDAGSDRVAVAPGAAAVAGVPVVVYETQSLLVPRPVGGSRVDRVVLRRTEDGTVVPTLLLGPVDGPGLALTHNPEGTWEQSLACLTVPPAGAGSIGITDERVYGGQRPGVTARVAAPDTGVTSVAGEAVPDLVAVLDLPRNATYDILADLSGQQGPVAGSTVWTLQSSQPSIGTGYLGTTPSLLNPGQIVLNAAGDRLYIADTGNNRLVVVDPTTWTHVGVVAGLTGITGVCVDSSNNIYATRVVSGTTYSIRKYNSILGQQWDTYPVASYTDMRHIATDGTHVYATLRGGVVVKLRCSDGVFVTSWGSAGSGNGQFNTPWGITVGGGQVGVVDAGNNRVQFFTTGGSYLRQFPTTGGCVAIAPDFSGRYWVSDGDDNLLRHYLAVGVALETVSVPHPHGLEVASGNVIWVVSTTGGVSAVQQWDEVITPAGYGAVAIEIGGSLSPYLGIGNRDGEIQNVHVGTANGPGEVTVRGYAKSVVGTATLRAPVLSVAAVPRR